MQGCDGHDCCLAVRYDGFLVVKARLFQFHGDHGTEEGGEGVITAALGFGGVRIVVR